MYVLEDFLACIRPFDCVDDFKKFKDELEKVPNFREVFAIELARDPRWLEIAEETRDSDGNFHVFFHLDRQKLPKYESYHENELVIRRFDSDKAPTIKVVTYRR